MTVFDMIKDDIPISPEASKDLKLIRVKLPDEIRDNLNTLLEVTEDLIIYNGTNITNTMLYSIVYNEDVSVSSLRQLWDLPKIKDMLLDISGGDRRILEAWINMIYYNNNNYSGITDNITKLTKELRHTKAEDYVTLSYSNICFIFNLFIVSFLSVSQINSSFKQEYYQYSIRYRATIIPEDAETYYMLGYYKDLDKQIKADIIKYFICLFIYIKFI